MKHRPNPKFQIVEKINDDTLVLGVPHGRFKKMLQEGFSEVFIQLNNALEKTKSAAKK